MSSHTQRETIRAYMRENNVNYTTAKRALDSTPLWRRPPSGSLTFPAQGTREEARWHAEFRSGRVGLGRGAHGGEVVIDLNRTAHVFITGASGAGKTSLLRLVTHGVLTNPDHADAIVIDTRGESITRADADAAPCITASAITPRQGLWEPPEEWGPEQVNQTNNAVAVAAKEMAARTALLREHGVTTLAGLRRGITDGSITGCTLASVPRRLIVLVDDAAVALNSLQCLTPLNAKTLPSGTGPEVEWLRTQQAETRAHMEKLGRLGSACEVNLVIASSAHRADLWEPLDSQMTARVYFRPRREGLVPDEVDAALENARTGTAYLRCTDSGAAKGAFRAYWLTPSRTSRERC